MPDPLPTNRTTVPPKDSLVLALFAFGFFPASLTACAVVSVGYDLVGVEAPAVLDVMVASLFLLGIYSAVIWIPVGLAALGSHRRQMKEYAESQSETPA